MKFLLNYYEKIFITFENNVFLITALDTKYDKLLKYFNQNKRNLIYIAVVVLNPTYK